MAKAKKKEALSLEEKLEQALVPVDDKPYEVPENWCWVKVGSVCVFENGYAFKADKFSEEGTIPVIRISNIKQNEVDINSCVYTMETDVDARFFAKYGDLLIAMSGATTGKNGVFLSNVPAYVNQRVGNIKVRNEKTLLPTYRNYYIMAMEEEILRGAYGGAQPNISSNKICDMNMPLPPLAEQQRIVEQIESLFAKLDEAKEKIEEALDGFQIRKLSVLHNAFEGQLTKGWREKLGKTYTEYRKEKLQKLTSAIGDGLHGTPCFDECGEYYFINGNNFAGKSIEIKADTKTVNAEEFEKYKKNLSSENTVFVSINGTLGKTAFYNDEPIILGKSACYLNVLPVLNKCYLRYYFETEEFMQYANDKATGSTIKNLGLKAMRELQINIPPFDEQEEVVRLLDDVFSKENLAMEKANEVLEQIDLMKKSILAKAFRGELGTNNPDEESSIELLRETLKG